METNKVCWGCGEPIYTGKHYHEGACRDTNKAKQNAQRRAVKVSQAASLNQGKPLGKWNKDLATRLAPLVIRSHAEVGRIMNLSSEGVRLIELRALSKIRAALMPFKRALSGEAKIKQVTQPIPSLSD